ncbi:MAG TPA: hypothetical protein PKA88_20415 [Polyangiaceae bacterium]|nr:hypothetical protein [Polyangiaceae bacterium]
MNEAQSSAKTLPQSVGNCWKRLILCSVLVLALAALGGCVAAETTEPIDTADQEMGLNGAPIHAVKWWNPLVPDVNEQASSAGLELPQGLTYPEAIKKICNHGIRAIFIRKAEPKIMRYGKNDSDGPCAGISNAACRNKINGRIADALEALKSNTSCGNKKPVVFIMQRQQLTTTEKMDQFAGVELKELLDKLDSRGVKSLVKGVALVENHLENSCQVKNSAVKIAKKINAKNNNWLRKRSLFVGGAGLGNKFKNIDSASNCGRGFRATMQDLRAETGKFSFIYKHFDNGKVQACSDWSKLNDPNISVVAAKEYLLNGCPGLKDLVSGIQAQKGDFPAHANVTFWGDKGDGVTNISKNVLEALHQIFIDDRGASNFGHVAFNRLFVKKPNSVAAACPHDEDHCKHLIQISSSHAASLNKSGSMNGVSTNVYQTWKGWQSDWAPGQTGGATNAKPDPEADPPPAGCGNDNECWRATLGQTPYAVPAVSKPKDKRLLPFIFDARFYLNLYPDVNKAAQTKGDQNAYAEWHWLNYGIKEGRIASPTFEPPTYLLWQPDVSAAYGATNYEAAIFHYAEHGRFEARRAGSSFDPTYYYDRYPDLQAAFGWDPVALLNHFVSFGLVEGRQAAAEFAPAWYLGVNPDVGNAWGQSYYRGGILHYWRYGRGEGRVGAP